MAPKAHFSEGEKVLCFHGPLLYEAKCLKAQIREKQMKYFIHYSGWNKNWDEWVPESRVLKYTDTNLQKQKALEEKYMSSKKGKVVKSSAKKETEKVRTTSQTAKSKEQAKVKAAVVPVVPPPEPTEESQKKSDVEPEPLEVPKRNQVEVKIALPEELCDWLMDDWDLITRQKKLVDVPASVTVDQIVASYTKHKRSAKKSSGSSEAIFVQVANKIRECFNVLLGKALLYKFERPQYGEILADYRGSSMCQLYGAIHLLRMFTKLGEMLESIPSIEPRTVPFLVEHFEDFTGFLASNPQYFSLDNYIVAPPEYHRRAL